VCTSYTGNASPYEHSTNARQLQQKTKQKILVNTAQMIEVTDRYSSVLMATNPLIGDDSLTPVIEGFGRLNGVKISNNSSTEHFPEDLVEVMKTRTSTRFSILGKCPSNTLHTIVPPKSFLNFLKYVHPLSVFW